MVHKRPCGAALSVITASTVLFAQYDLMVPAVAVLGGMSIDEVLNPILLVPCPRPLRSNG